MLLSSYNTQIQLIFYYPCPFIRYEFRRGLITYPNSLSDIQKAYPELVFDFRRDLFGYQNLPYIMFVFKNTKYFGFLEYDVSDITFRICYLVPTRAISAKVKRKKNHRNVAPQNKKSE